jgi:hypothetical protein
MHAARYAQPVITDRAAGWYFLVMGVVFLLPMTGRAFKRASERELRLMPWLNKLPWISLYRNGIYQTVLRLLVGTAFVAFGLLMAFGVIRPN